jgi:hypothetical protein
MSVSVSGRGGLLLRVASEGVTTKRQLERWVQRGVAYARPLPLKKK